MAPSLKHSGAIGLVTAMTLLSSRRKTQELYPKAFVKRQSQAEDQEAPCAAWLPLPQATAGYSSLPKIITFHLKASWVVGGKLVGWLEAQLPA